MESFGCLCYLNIEQSVARRPALGISECFSVRVRAQKRERNKNMVLDAHIRQLKGQSYKFRSVITLNLFSHLQKKEAYTDRRRPGHLGSMHVPAAKPQEKRKCNGSKTGDILEGIPRAAPDVGVHGGTDPTSARHRHRQFVTHKKHRIFF